MVVSETTWPQTKPSANTGFQHKAPWNKVDLRMVTECMEKKSTKKGAPRTISRPRTIAKKPHGSLLRLDTPPFGGCN